MLGTGAAATPWQNFTSVGNKALQALDVFVIGRADFVGAKLANLAAGGVAPPGCATRNVGCSRGDAAPTLDRLLLLKLLVLCIGILSHCFTN